MARNTSTGKDAEKSIVMSLERGGYSFNSQVKIPNLRPNNKDYIVDYIAKKESKKIGIEMKWQQSDGTAEEKIPYALILLLILYEKKIIDKGYLVLGGSDQDKIRKRKGWTLRKYYLSGGLEKFIKYKGKIDILTIEEFQSDANQSKL